MGVRVSVSHPIRGMTGNAAGHVKLHTSKSGQWSTVDDDGGKEWLTAYFICVFIDLFLPMRSRSWLATGRSLALPA